MMYSNPCVRNLASVLGDRVEEEKVKYYLGVIDNTIDSLKEELEEYEWEDEDDDFDDLNCDREDEDLEKLLDKLSLDKNQIEAQYALKEISKETYDIVMSILNKYLD